MSRFLRRYSWVAVMLLSATLAILSFFTLPAYRESTAARHVASYVSRHLATLDNQAEKLLSSAAEERIWPDDAFLSQDMALFRYVSDTIQTWSGYLPLSDGEMPGLVPPREDYSPVMLGGEPYLVKKQVRICEDSVAVTVVAGLHLHDIPSFEYEFNDTFAGTPVVLSDGSVPFRLIQISPDAAVFQGTFMRWLSLLFLSISLVMLCALKRNLGTLIWSVSIVLAAAVLGRFLGMRLGLFSDFFSSGMFSRGSIINSMSALLVMNLVFFMGALATYLCRSAILRRAARLTAGGKRLVSCFFLAASAVVVVLTFSTFGQFIRNARFDMVFYRLDIKYVYLILIHLSYLLALAGVWLLMEIFCRLISDRKAKGYSCLSRWPSLIYACGCAVALSIIAQYCDVQREKEVVEQWSVEIAAGQQVTGGRFVNRENPLSILPPPYSYARYEQGRLMRFSGNFAYPTQTERLRQLNPKHLGTLSINGYRHFIHKTADCAIVISRREAGVLSRLSAVSYLALVLYILLLIFRHREKEAVRVSHFFSTRVRRLTTLSLFGSLVIMAVLSISFVNRRNERNRMNMMSERISTIQVMLDNLCAEMTSSAQMDTPGFAGELQTISINTHSSISIYNPDGRLFIAGEGSSPALRMSAEAFRNLAIAHNRYYIGKDDFSTEGGMLLYAPVFNRMGNVIAVGVSPFREKDYDFTKDVLVHSAAMLSLFLILLFVAVALATSVTGSIFHPLLQMNEKMKGKSPDDLQYIEYEGKDEISALVQAYNTMVDNLRASSRDLAAVERDKAWSQMARQIAHEIKNPLTPIKLKLQYLVLLKQKGDASWADKFDDVSKIVLEQIDVLSETATEFSTFARLDSQPGEEIDLDGMLREQVMLFDGSGTDPSDERRVAIAYRGYPGAVTVGPRPQLVRVFVNLLTNAVQALSGAAVADPRVLVQLQKEGEGWTISVEDNGPGVDPENRDRLFSPNFTTKSSGAGLGLAIVRSIVEHCGGSISYSVGATLGGACFVVRLPR